MTKTNLVPSGKTLHIVESSQKNYLRVAFKSEQRVELCCQGFEYFPVSNPLQKLVQRNSFFLLRLVK
jgi:hypothetical protein